ncbi:hypothetical protein [Limnoraphis robusta]|uniref:hypothetical protein n=1 Tax=Limnoraphis robusta TaxID=1118279 RepID=UPI002B203447|nr:hypothetical protein [Limnoraphis robusta]MEA5497949.1 hypothetical protein [Limnoraphis robusta BA-68 BA1]
MPRLSRVLQAGYCDHHLGKRIIWLKPSPFGYANRLALAIAFTVPHESEKCYIISIQAVFR